VVVDSDDRPCAVPPHGLPQPADPLQPACPPPLADRPLHGLHPDDPNGPPRQSSPALEQEPAGSPQRRTALRYKTRRPQSISFDA
jgi:hypothetical protein